MAWPPCLCPPKLGSLHEWFCMCAPVNALAEQCKRVHVLARLPLSARARHRFGLQGWGGKVQAW